MQSTCFFRRIRLVILASILVGATVWLNGSAGARELTAANDTLLVNFRDERLTVRVNAIPLRTVLEAVGRHTGVGLTFEGSLDETIVASFDALPLDEGMKRLLRRKNYVLLYAASGSGRPRLILTKVSVFGEGRLEERRSGEDPTELGRRQTTLARPGPINPTQVMEPAWARDVEATMQHELLQTLEQEDNGATRAAALRGLEGFTSVPIGPLAAIARNDRDPVIRLGALKLLARRATGNPQVRAVAEEVATAEPDDAVREFATALLKVFRRGEMATR